jgi:hypothetical protein
MMQGYIVYWEGHDEKGFVINNGNSGLDIEYSDFVSGKELLMGAMEGVLTAAQQENPRVIRVVIKGVFKL